MIQSVLPQYDPHHHSKYSSHLGNIRQYECDIGDYTGWETHTVHDLGEAVDSMAQSAGAHPESLFTALYNLETRSPDATLFVASHHYANRRSVGKYYIFSVFS
jgi:hypothetical protein